MKRLIFLLLLFLPVLGHAQGFWQPVNKDMFLKTEGRALTSVWLPRPYFDVNAIRINLGANPTIQPFASLGTGVSLALFKEVNGAPYQVFAANFAVLFGTDITELKQPLELSIAVTATIYQHISAGIGYDVTNKNLFLLTSYTFNFN